jgi:hypothetical protein
VRYERTVCFCLVVYCFLNIAHSKKDRFFFFVSNSFSMGVKSKKRDAFETDELPSRPDAYESLLKRMRGNKKRKAEAPVEPKLSDSEDSISEGEDEENSDNDAVNVAIEEESETIVLEADDSDKNSTGF